MSKLAEILGGKDDQVFIMKHNGAKCRIHDGELQFYENNNEWYNWEGVSALYELINGKLDIVWLRTDEQRRECQLLRRMSPEATKLRTDHEYKGTRWCEVYDDDECLIMRYRSKAFLDTPMKTNFLINEVLGEDVK